MKPWLDYYPSDVPHSIDLSANSSVVGLFDEAVAMFPEHIALECFGHTITFQQVDRASNALATALQNQYSVKKGDHVAVMLPNIFAYQVVMLAVMKVGAVQVNVNPLYTPRELEHQLNDSGSEIIFLYSGSAQSLAPIRDQTSIRCDVNSPKPGR